MLWLLAVMTLLGLVLLALGLCGRVVGDAPHCGSCKFDLSGLDLSWRDDPFTETSGHPICPECALELFKPGAIQTGQRVMHRRVAIAGASILAILAGPILFWLVASTTISPANLPTIALEFGVKQSGSHQFEFFDELHNRRIAGTYPKADWDAQLKAAITWLDPSTPEGTAITIEILQAVAAGTQPQSLGKSVLDKFYTLELEIPSRVRPGDKVQYSITRSSRFDVAVSDRSGFSTIYWLDPLNLRVIDDETGEILHDTPMPGSYSGGSSHSGSRSGGLLSIPITAEPGTELRFEVVSTFGMGPGRLLLEVTTQRTIETTVRVVEQATSLVELRSEPDLVDAVCDGLELELRVQGNWGQLAESFLSPSVRIDNLEAAVVADLYLQIEGSLVPCGHVQLEARDPSSGPLNAGYGPTRITKDGTYPALARLETWPETVTVWMVPDPDRAEQMAGYETILGIPLIVRDVPLLVQSRRNQDPDGRGAAGVPSEEEMAEFERMWSELPD